MSTRRVTLATAKEYCKRLGFTLVKDSSSGEYALGEPNKPDTRYYSDNLDDVCSTANVWHQTKTSDRKPQ
jgi:hypothetical protein